MGLVKRFIEMVQSGYPEFDPQNDSVEIEFEGGGDSFGSFSYLGVWPNREGNVNMEDHTDLLFEILDASGVEYNWNNAGTTGRITYNEDVTGGLSVSTVISEEYWGEIEDEEEVEIVYDEQETKRKDD
jgi:hypothetical protein